MFIYKIKGVVAVGFELTCCLGISIKVCRPCV